MIVSVLDTSQTSEGGSYSARFRAKSFEDMHEILWFFAKRNPNTHVQIWIDYPDPGQSWFWRGRFGDWPAPIVRVFWRIRVKGKGMSFAWGYESMEKARAAREYFGQNFEVGKICRVTVRKKRRSK